IGNLDNIIEVEKLTVFVASAPEFTAQPKVANGASELIGKIFGDAGKHVRSAVGVTSLPLDAAVEIEMIVLVK
ncbi:MAG: RidA family protein, partial [Ignavibacterium sp.]|nr:RidA family protein [Ignavibacterium sp.]